MKRKIVATYDPEAIILFGSCAKTKKKKKNDIDLLILKETTDRPIDRRICVEKILSDRKYPIDILVYTPQEIRFFLSIGSPFIEEVIETGKLIYMRNATEQWLKDAEDELASATILLEHQRYKGVCIHSQQSVERGLKALIIEKGKKPTKVHDINGLRNKVQKFGYEINLSTDNAVFLNSIYKGRYPGEEGLLPYGEPSGKDAERAVEAAKGFMQSLRKILT